MAYTTLAFYNVILAITPTRPNGLTSAPGVVNPYLFSNVYRDSNGSLHEGVDFQYNESLWLSQQPTPNNLGWGDGPVNSSHPPVYAPVSGTVVDVDTRWGWVVIQVADGTYHRLMHMRKNRVREQYSLICPDDRVGVIA